MSEQEREGTNTSPKPGRDRDLARHDWANLNAQHDALCLRYYGSADIEAEPELDRETFMAWHSAIHLELAGLAERP